MPEGGQLVIKFILALKHASEQARSTMTLKWQHDTDRGNRFSTTAGGRIDAMTKWIVRYAAEFGDDKAI